MNNIPNYSHNSARLCLSPVFQTATSILFFVSCIAYDQFTDGVKDSFRLFDIATHPFFAKSVILFFTKADLLEEKIKHSNIKDYFPEFQGDPRKLVDVKGFLFQIFDDRRQGKSKALYHYFIAAGSAENIRGVFPAIEEISLENINNWKSV